MRKITKIIIHYTDSGDIPASTIRQWHKAKNWADIGYHKVIRRDGSIEAGRPESQPGAHTKGFNLESLGVVLTGSNRLAWYPATAQLQALENVIADWRRKYGPVKVYRHKDLNATSCPGRLDLKDIQPQEEDNDMSHALIVQESDRGYQILGADNSKGGKVKVMCRKADGPATEVRVHVHRHNHEPKQVNKELITDAEPRTVTIDADDAPGDFAIQVTQDDVDKPVALWVGAVQH